MCRRTPSKCSLPCVCVCVRVETRELFRYVQLSNDGVVACLAVVYSESNFKIVDDKFRLNRSSLLILVVRNLLNGQKCRKLVLKESGKNVWNFNLFFYENKVILF